MGDRYRVHDVTRYDPRDPALADRLAAELDALGASDDIVADLVGQASRLEIDAWSSGMRAARAECRLADARRALADATRALESRR